MIEQQTLFQIYIVILVGVFFATILPILIGLRIWVRSGDYDKDKLDWERRLAVMEVQHQKDFVSKDDMAELKKDLDRRLSEISRSIERVFDKLDGSRA